MSRNAQVTRRMNVKRRKKKRVLQEADDVLRFGPITMASFGNKIFSRNNNTPEQHQAIMQKMAESLSDVKADIDAQIVEFVRRIRRHRPLELLRYAYGNFAAAALGKTSEPEWSSNENATVWTLEYIFNVVAATPLDEFGDAAVIQEDYARIVDGVQKLFSNVGVNFAIASTAKRKLDGAIKDDEYEKLFTKCQMHWCSVRKSRYSVHDKPYLSYFLTPHDDVFRELFSISAEEFISAVDSIAQGLARGLGGAVETMAAIHKQFRERLEDYGEIESPEQVREVVDALGLTEKMEQAARRFFGDYLFDVQKVVTLPVPLLDLLSWTPGEDTDFLAPGEFCGWPLRLPSVKKRPFLKLDGRYYCHLSYGLVDNVYRVIQKAIVRLKPEYATTWKDRQQEVSERLPVELFQRLLPNARSLQSVRYQWPATQAKDKNWCEADAILIYDDHLIVVEVKAGAFTYTSPTNDFSSYIESVKTLIQKPADQAIRFLGYLNSVDEVPLYQLDADRNHVEVARLSKASFRHVTSCGVTLDNFTHLAAQAHGLKALGVNFKGVPFWSLAIDDLMIYVDLFNSPIRFAHYLEQRQIAIRTPRFELSDEVDHLGMYLKHNHYAGKVDEFPDGTPVWRGYSADIDSYCYNLLTEPEVAARPTQKLPDFIERIIATLDQSDQPGRCRVGGFLLDYGDDGRNDVASSILTGISTQLQCGRLRPLLIGGGDMADMSVYCSTPGLTWELDQALGHARKSMIVSRKPEHLILLVGVDAAKQMTSVDWRFISKSELSARELQKLEAQAAALKRNRVAAELKRRDRPRIGRNEPCPCGSRVKYKKCCGRSADSAGLLS